MILRSVMRHVREQNWVAVFLDFVIVVVGVFIGIQVANWNESRRERIEEETIVERLRAEVDALIEVQRAELAGNTASAERLLPVQPVLFGQAPVRPLTVGECTSILSSHIYRRPTDDLPVLDEIRETGRFDLLRDPELKRTLRSYILLRERTRGRFDEISNGLFRLHSRHPDLLQVERVPLEAGREGAWTYLSGEGFRWDPICHVELMRESPAFLNEYVDNLSRTNSLLMIYEERIQMLEKLKAVLESSRSGSPDSDTPP